MSIIGSWKIDELLQLDEDFNEKWVKAADILADPETDPSDAQSLSLIHNFGEDGTLRIAMDIPEDISKEEVDEIVASGEMKLYGDNQFLLEEHEWKEENGVFTYNTGAKLEIFDEEVSSWETIEVLDDGRLQLLMYKLVRA